MRLRKIGMIGALLLTLAGMSACQVSVPAPVRADLLEGYRTTVEDTLKGMGFSDAKAEIVGKNDESTSASPAASPTTSTQKVVVATFTITGTKCRGKVEQQLDPPGEMYFREVILPDGKTAAKDAKPPVQLAPLDIFQFAHDIPVCQIPGVTAPTPIPTASGTANVSAGPTTTP